MSTIKKVPAGAGAEWLLGAFALLRKAPLALASLVIVLLGIATWKGWREGSLLQAEPVALIAVAGSDQPPRPQ